MAKKQKSVVLGGGRNQVGLASETQDRILGELDDASFHLAGARMSPVASIHDTRRCLKRARAVCEMIESASPGDVKEGLRLLKAAGRLLGPIRDKHVADALAGERGKTELKEGERLLILEATAMILAVRRRVADYWDLGGVSRRVIRGELDSSYRQARKTWRSALDSREVEDFHNCRKATKRTYYQLKALADAGPGATDRMADFRRMGQLLGDHHDLLAVSGNARSARAQGVEEELVELGSRLYDMNPSEQATWSKPFTPTK